MARIDATLLLGGLLLSGDRALRTLAGAGVGLGALTAHGKSLTVTLALVAVDLDLATDVRVDFTTQIALDLVIAFEVITQRNQLLIRQILDANIRVDTGRGKRFLGTSATYTENIGEGDLDALLIGDVDSGKITRQFSQILFTLGLTFMVFLCLYLFTCNGT